MRKSIRRRLTLAFVSMGVVPLLLAGSFLIFECFQIEKEHAIDLQEEVVKRVANETGIFISEIVEQLHWEGHHRHPRLVNLERNEQAKILQEIVSDNEEFESLGILDLQGKEWLSVNTDGPMSSTPRDFSGEDVFKIPAETHQRYFSKGLYQEDSGERLIMIGMPLMDPEKGTLEGVLFGHIRTEVIWRIIRDATFTTDNDVYIINGDGQVTVHSNRNIVAAGGRITLPEKAGIGRGLDGKTSVIVFAERKLGQDTYTIVAERLIGEALAFAFTTAKVVGGFLLIAVVSAGVLGSLAVRRIVRPIEALAETAGAIESGDLSRKAIVGNEDEIGQLAQSFNSMTGRLHKSLEQLERDIQERKAAEAKLARLARVLEDKNRELENIIWVMSHDLRGPLVNVSGFSRELAMSCDEIRAAFKEDDIPEELRAKLSNIIDEDIPEAVGLVGTSVSKIDSLLTSLVRLARTGTASMEIVQLNMTQLAREVVKTFQFQANQQAVEVRINELPDCYGDKEQVGQIFSNLISNALQNLSPGRKGLIRIYGREGESENVYCVEDNGIGIKENKLEKIFKVFYRGSHNKNDGEGLGLSIVKQTVNRHHGRAWVESEVGVGSKFYVSLPGQPIKLGLD